MSITTEPGTAPEPTEPTIALDPIEDAVAAMAAGRPVVVVDDDDRENEGDLIFAAEKATPELLAFMIRYTSGVVCVPMEGGDLDRLALPLMVERNEESMRTAYTVTVDARTGVGTGISAADRARTIALLADAEARPVDFVRPGHVLPLRYREGGVLARRGHTEASVDLARLAGLRPAGVLAEVVNDDGTMARLPELRAFADAHGLVLVSVEQLVAYRQRTENGVERVVETRLPNRYGEWRAIGYRAPGGAEHLALVYGDVSADRPVPVRVHSECLTGDVLGSHRCDCGSQLDNAMRRISEHGSGIIVYLRGHEGRGIGLLHKLEAYRLQDGGADTVEANLRLGLPADARDFTDAAHILSDLGATTVTLLSNNPAKVAGLTAAGLTVTRRIALPGDITTDNLRYLRTKSERLGHDVPGLAGAN